MTMREVIAFIEGYARASGAPVETETTVTSVRADDGGYVVTTDRDEWRAATVVIATGACNIPKVPALAASLPSAITSITPDQYRNPGQLEDGGVLVVGAAATGMQLADEIHRSGRPVTVAVGEHVRAPRIYRGMDIQWWLDAVGLMDERYDEVDNVVRVRSLPSFQLVGTPDRTTLDLNALTANGVQLVGRFAGINDGKAQFSGSLRNHCAMADLKLGRLLDTIDEWASTEGVGDEFEAPHRFAPTEVEESPPLGLDLDDGRIRTVLWATGFSPDYSWLDVPVLDRKGRLRHDGGVVDAAGLYVMGLPFLRRRKSTLIDGAGDDARDLSAHLAAYLDAEVARPA
jgi:putative flavoprotein involved in K+ transport